MQPAREIRFPCHCPALVLLAGSTYQATAVEISKQSVVIVGQDGTFSLPENTAVVLRLALKEASDWETAAHVIREARIRTPVLGSPGDVSVFQHGVALRFELRDDTHSTPLFAFLTHLEER